MFTRFKDMLKRWDSSPDMTTWDSLEIRNQMFMAPLGI